MRNTVPRIRNEGENPLGVSAWERSACDPGAPPTNGIMKTPILCLLSVVLVGAPTAASGSTACPSPVDAPLKVHGIFRSNMVLQRDKPIKIWGWATTGGKVHVSLGALSAKATAKGERGRWEVTFKPQTANSQPQTITVTSGDKKLQMTNILIGDAGVMNGQSNMGNLKVEAKPWQPLHSFRTDTSDWAGEMDHTDPDIRKKSGAANKETKAQAKLAFENRKKFEAARK